MTDFRKNHAESARYRQLFIALPGLFASPALHVVTFCPAFRAAL
jgi:hypothetical protein